MGTPNRKDTEEKRKKKHDCLRMTSLPSRGWGKSAVLNEMHETKKHAMIRHWRLRKRKKKRQKRFCASFKLLVFPVNKIKKFPCKRKLYNSVNLGKLVKARTTDYLLT